MSREGRQYVSGPRRAAGAPRGCGFRGITCCETFWGWAEKAPPSRGPSPPIVLHLRADSILRRQHADAHILCSGCSAPPLACRTASRLPRQLPASSALCPDSASSLASLRSPFLPAGPIRVGPNHRRSAALAARSAAGGAGPPPARVLSAPSSAQLSSRAPDFARLVAQLTTLCHGLDACGGQLRWV